MAAQREHHRGSRFGKGKRTRNPPARASRHHNAARRRAHDGVVDAAHNVAIVEKQQVGNVPETRLCLPVAPADRFVGEVAGGHDQGGILRVAEQFHM